jgi:hypothetical protein
MSGVPLFNIPPIDPRTGRWNQSWLLFLVDLWTRTGGSQPNGIGDLTIADAGPDATAVEASVELVRSKVDDLNLLAGLVSDEPDSRLQYKMASHIVDLILLLQETQDAAARATRALQDAVIDQIVSIDPIRSMAYQDAAKVKITGGTISGMSQNDATSVAITDDATTNATMYPLWSTATGGQYAPKTSSTKWTFNPSTGLMTVPSISSQFNGTLGLTTPAAAAVTTLSASGQITSTLATGTAPFSITSTTVVPNLNVSQLLSGTWAIPGAIGSTTPNTGAFTTLTTTSNAAVGTTSSSWGSGFRAIEVGAQGNAYFSANSGSFNSLLTNNAYFDGSNWKYVRSSAATHIEQITGSLKFMTAPSGTAGNTITWTQRLLVDTNGATATALTLTSATPTVAASQVGFGTTTATTVGAAGAASAPPANPVGYLVFNLAGTAYKLPYYNA